MSQRRSIPINVIHSKLEYDASTGLFRWRSPCRKNQLRGWFSGHKMRGGYFSIWLNNYPFKAHRVAWAMHYGEWPDADIDHIDVDPGNNKIENLRLATHSENHANIKIRADNTSGLKGVFWHSGAKKWMAQIRYQQKAIYLGLFETREAAHAAYTKAAIDRFGEFARS